MISVQAAGSPGPLEKKIPSGRIDRTSAGGVNAGTTVTLHAESTKKRKLFRLTPKS